MNRALYLSLLLIGLSGCVPAHYVRHTPVAKPCDVMVSITNGASIERFGCMNDREVLRQMQLYFGATP